jgi:hypothetical protein
MVTYQGIEHTIRADSMVRTVPHHHAGETPSFLLGLMRAGLDSNSASLPECAKSLGEWRKRPELVLLSCFHYTIDFNWNEAI